MTTLTNNGWKLEIYDDGSAKAFPPENSPVSFCPTIYKDCNPVFIFFDFCKISGGVSAPVKTKNNNKRGTV